MFPRNKYVIIANSNLSAFDTDSAKALWVSKSRGIQEIMATKGDKSAYSSVAFVFPVAQYSVDEAKEWVRDKFGSDTLSRNELLASKRVRIASPAILCKSAPNLTTSASTNPQELDRESVAKLNDKYYLHVDGVHSGMNLNGDFFLKEELTKNYESAAFQLFDWEHNRDEVIGTSHEASLRTIEEDELALSVNAVLNRTSPHMQREERVGDVLITRDELVKQRYFEGTLAVSMECVFDKMRCTECQYESDDFIDFDFHVIMSHSHILESGGKVGRELVGLDFTGWGLVKQPADVRAFVTSLRTSDDGTIQDIVSAKTKEYGKLAASLDFARTILSANSFDDTFAFDDNSQFSFASEKKVGVNTPKKVEQVVNSKQNEKITGGLIMFDLKKKTEACKTLSEILKVAQSALRDLQGDKPLTEEASKAFVSELSEVIGPVIATDEFRVVNIFEVTATEKLEAISAARKEEEEKATVQKNGLDAQITKLTEDKTALKTALAASEEVVSNFNKDKVDAETEVKVDEIITELASAGVKYEGKILNAAIRAMVREKIADEEGLKALKTELTAQAKREVLVDASGQPTGAGKGDEGNDDFLTKLNEARKNKE